MDYNKQTVYTASGVYKEAGGGGGGVVETVEIDGKVYFTSDDVVNQGEDYTVLIESVDEYDLYGRTI